MGLNKSSVMIVSETKNGEKICASSARISTKAGSAKTIYKEASDKEKNINLVSKVISSGHKTILEHHYFNLAFTNVSVTVEQFLIEHRLLSFTIKSRRYVNFSNIGYNLPKSLVGTPRKKVQNFIEKMFKIYDTFVQNNIHIEDARFVLPYAFSSNLYCSGNAREIMHLICIMIYGRGKNYEEVFELGEKLKTLFEKRYPGLIEKEKYRYDKYEDMGEYIPADSKLTFDKAEVSILKHDKFENDIMQEYQKILNIPTFSIKNCICDGKYARILEQFNYTFTIKNISLPILTHLSRHRIQSLIVPPIYSFINSTNYVLPTSIKDNSELLSLYESAIQESRELLSYLKEQNISKYIFPYITLSGTTVNIITTMNARELMHFIRLRTCNRAQWEIREIAKSLLIKLRKDTPEIFSYYGPSCYLTNSCPEGKLTCGKLTEVVESFKSL